MHAAMAHGGNVLPQWIVQHALRERCVLAEDHLRIPIQQLLHRRLRETAAPGLCGDIAATGELDGFHVDGAFQPGFQPVHATPAVHPRAFVDGDFRQYLFGQIENPSCFTCQHFATRCHAQQLACLRKLRCMIHKSAIDQYTGNAGLLPDAFEAGNVRGIDRACIQNQIRLQRQQCLGSQAAAAPDQTPRLRKLAVSLRQHPQGFITQCPWPAHQHVRGEHIYQHGRRRPGSQHATHRIRLRQFPERYGHRTLPSAGDG